VHEEARPGRHPDIAIRTHNCALSGIHGLKPQQLAVKDKVWLRIRDADVRGTAITCEVKNGNKKK
jgi:hypothetical protein